MDRVVDKGNISVVTTEHHVEEGLAHLNILIHHTLTPELRDQLLHRVEQMAVKLIEVWAEV